MHFYNTSEKKQFSSTNLNLTRLYKSTYDSKLTIDLKIYANYNRSNGIVNNATEIISSESWHSKWDPKRDVLVFLHIQKTGGTFFERELAQLLLRDGEINLDANPDSDLNSFISYSPNEYYYKPACICVFIFARCKCVTGNDSIWLFLP